MTKSERLTLQDQQGADPEAPMSMAWKRLSGACAEHLKDFPGLITIRLIPKEKNPERLSSIGLEFSNQQTPFLTILAKPDKDIKYLICPSSSTAGCTWVEVKNYHMVTVKKPELYGIKESNLTTSSINSLAEVIERSKALAFS